MTSAWKNYAQACDARWSHIHVDHCLWCWADFPGAKKCAEWHTLSLEIERTMDIWLGEII